MESDEIVDLAVGILTLCLAATALWVSYGVSKIHAGNLRINWSRLSRENWENRAITMHKILDYIESYVEELESINVKAPYKTFEHPTWEFWRFPSKIEDEDIVLSKLDYTPEFIELRKLIRELGQSLSERRKNLYREIKKNMRAQTQGESFGENLLYEFEGPYEKIIRPFVKEFSKEIFDMIREYEHVFDNFSDNSSDEKIPTVVLAKKRYDGIIIKLSGMNNN